MGRWKPLSTITIALVDVFANKYSEFGQVAPSLFFTREGNRQLSWEDKEGRPLEVEFFPEKLEFYVGRTDEEGSINIAPENPIKALEQLIEHKSPNGAASYMFRLAKILFVRSDPLIMMTRSGGFAQVCFVGLRFR